MIKVRAMRLVIVAITIFVIVALSSNIVHAEKSFNYVIVVDDEGRTNVTVFFYDNEDGSSWLLVPKDQRELIDVTVYKGELLNVTYRSLIEGGRESPFYVIMRFDYKASEVINLSIRYSMKHGALIIEPHAIFISPRITHEETLSLVVVHLPSRVEVLENGVSALSGYIRNVSITRSNDYLIISAIIGPDDRLIVEYTVPERSELSDVTLGSFIFKVHPRYLDFAFEVLKALNNTYSIYENIFETKPSNIQVEFFVPSKRDIVLGLMGYVPIVGKSLGPIYLNILYIRSVKGFMSIAAIHELTHHFLSSINVPTSKLWIHEGVAQYMSLVVGYQLGYCEAFEMYEGTLESGLKKLGNYLGFVQKWSPYSEPPEDIGQYYAASYCIIKTLCDRYGGLDYLKRLFSILKQLSPIDWYDDVKIIEAFGVAAGNVSEVVDLFHKWGFEVKEPSLIIPSISQIKESISNMPIWLEPYKNIARMMINMAELLQQHSLLHVAIMVARVSQLIHELSFSFMFISSIIIAIVIIALLKRIT
ncbi:MAG: hypothetical protein QXD66_05155 [Candidatus Nezhaarchaeales archaeon]|nr:MAG: hypothetical protein DSO06_05600 [Candidatus Nezhaarchaeota archaeon WYZ-LMO8]TDA35787.1 MAG: hypothetical protein DSO05_04795 [Candidatus Nezhaarchaeota archaeon WYZ-LMO7]